MVFVNIWMLDVDWTLPAQAVVSVKQAFTHLSSLGFLLFQHLAKDLAMFCFVSSNSGRGPLFVLETRGETDQLNVK